MPDPRQRRSLASATAMTARSRLGAALLVLGNLLGIVSMTGAHPDYHVVIGLLILDVIGWVALAAFR